MKEDSGLGKAEAILNLGERLKFITIARLAAFAVVAAFSWYLIEHRDTAVPALLANQLIVTLAGAAIVILLISPALMWAFNRFQSQSDELHKRMQSQINDARQDLVEYKAEVKAQMLAVNAAEQRCQRALSRVTIALHEHGITPPANTGWGDLP